MGSNPGWVSADSRETSFNLAKMQNEFEDAFNADEIMENAFNISTEIVLFWGSKVYKQKTNKIVLEEISNK